MVFVLDKHGKALMPCTEKRARLLLERGRARVHRVLPMESHQQMGSHKHCKLIQRSDGYGYSLNQDYVLIL